MNRLRQIVISMLALTAVLLTTSCGNQGAKKARYELEREYFLANKMVEDAQIRPDLNAPETNQRILDAHAILTSHAFTAFSELDPQTDSAEYRDISVLTFRSATRLAQLLFAERRFDSASVVLGHLVTSVPLPASEQAEAMVRLAQALQGIGKIDSALAYYSRAIQRLDPPVNREGEVSLIVFNVPAHLARLASRRGDSTGALSAFNDAMTYYQRQAQVNFLPLQAASNAMLGRLYTEVGDWNNAIASLSQLRDSTGNVNTEAKMRIADIRSVQLGQYQEALKLYDEIIVELRGRDTLMRPAVMSKKSLVLSQMNRFEDARKTLVEIQGKYPAYYGTNPLPQLFKARTFEAEGNLERAETEYKFLLDNYQVGEQTFQTLLHLSEMYQSQGRTVEADRMLERAEQTFDQAATQASGTANEALALSYKAELLRREENWQGAAEVLVSIFDKFPASSVGQRAVLTAAGLYRDKLGNRAMAESLVDRYVKSMTGVDEEES